MAFVAYILPLIVVGIISFFVNNFFESKATADGISFLILIITIFITASLGKRFFKGDRYQSSITEVLKNEQI